MGIEHVDVGVHPAHVRAGCRVELETAQLIALLEVFTKATVAVAEKLSGLGARLAAAEADE